MLSCQISKMWSPITHKSCGRLAAGRTLNWYGLVQHERYPSTFYYQIRTDSDVLIIRLF